MNSQKMKTCLFLGFYSAVLLLPIFLFYSCSTMEIQQREVKQEDIIELEDHIKNDSLDSDAIKRLSILLVQAHQNKKANYYLAKALQHLPDDNALLFYQGLNYEFLGDTLNAINYYSRYKEASVFSPYKKLMEGRYQVLNRHLVYKDIRNLISGEKSFNAKNISSNTLAVFPLTYHGTNNKYEPLSRGLSEMISIDLGKVKKLTVLERIRLNAVLDELKLSKTSLVEQKTAPRMGKLLSARLLFSGSLDITNDDNLKMEVNSWDMEKNKMGDWLNKSGQLEDIFLVEKELVFEIIDQIGINLTQEERQNIEFIPTKDINAFLEFSKGLEAEDNGQYDAAVSFYQNAVNIDPDFKDASTKSEMSSDISNVSGNSEEVLGRTQEITSGESQLPASNIDVTQSRFDMLGSEITSSFNQGLETREAPQEAASTGIEDLPLPPPPPGK
jgi:tetratricopeptide (TPR) repeat protein